MTESIPTSKDFSEEPHNVENPEVPSVPPLSEETESTSASEPSSEASTDKDDFAFNQQTSTFGILGWGSEEDRKFDNEELKQQKEQLKTRLEDINTNLGIVQSNIDKYGKGEVPINLQRNKDYWEDQKEK